MMNDYLNRIVALPGTYDHKCEKAHNGEEPAVLPHRIGEQFQQTGSPAHVLTCQLEKAPLPAILYWKQCHFVVLYRIDTKKRRYHIADPAGDKLVLSEEEFARNWQAS